MNNKHENSVSELFGELLNIMKTLREENKSLRTVEEPFICFLCEQEAEEHKKYICEKIQHLDERVEDADRAMSCWCEWVKHDGKVCGVCVYREKYKEVPKKP